MLRLSALAYAVFITSSCAKHVVSPKPLPADPRIALEFRTSPIEMCEGSSVFAAVAVGWVGQGDPPADAPPEITWESHDSTIVRVNSKGELTPIAPGSTSVDATAHWGNLLGRKSLPVQVLRGKVNLTKTNETGHLACGQ